MKRNFHRQNTIYLVFLTLMVVLLFRIYSDDLVKRNPEGQNGLVCLFKRFLSSFTRMSYIQKLSGISCIPRRKNDAIVIIYWTKVFGNPVNVGNSRKWKQQEFLRRAPVSCEVYSYHRPLQDT